MLKINDLHAQLSEEKTVILSGINLSVNPGELHLILGPNGSGKSTLGRVILGDENYEQTSGMVELFGENTAEMEPAERAGAGYFLSFQSPPEIDGVAVKDFLFAAKKALDPDFSSSYRFKKQLETVFELLRLPKEFIDRETNVGFSGGERKKLEVASMMVLEPKLAFLDEIDSGVDIDTIRRIGEGLRNFLEDKEKSLILVTHSDKLLQEIQPTHVHVMAQGKIVQTGDQSLAAEIQKNGFDQYLPQSQGFSMS